MGITIVGGDNIQRICCNLCKNGNCILKHISGRKSSHCFFEIPKNTDLIIIFTDFVNHKLCEHIKSKAKKMGIRTIYTKRAWSSIEVLL